MAKFWARIFTLSFREEKTRSFDDVEKSVA